MNDFVEHEYDFVSSRLFRLVLMTKVLTIAAMKNDSATDEMMILICCRLLPCSARVFPIEINGNIQIWGLREGLVVHH